MKNFTESDLLIQVKGEPLVTVPSGKDMVVYKFSITGVWGDYLDPTGLISDLEVTINGELMSEEIWSREYWRYESGKKYYSTYVLDIDDELLNSLTIKKQQ